MLESFPQRFGSAGIGETLFQEVPHSSAGLLGLKKLHSVNYFLDFDPSSSKDHRLTKASAERGAWLWLAPC